jgi:pimeloyl-ACP methyl ester carboxylesterase
MLSGDRDPFATIQLLEREIKKLSDVELHIYPGVGHGVLSEIEDAADTMAKFLKAHK